MVNCSIFLPEALDVSAEATIGRQQVGMSILDTYSISLRTGFSYYHAAPKIISSDWSRLELKNDAYCSTRHKKTKRTHSCLNSLDSLAPILVEISPTQ